PHDRIAAVYDQCDIYLNGSLIDNQPLSLLEAFASGLPVVTTNAGGIPDIVRNEITGLLVNCGDHQAMADAALRVLRDEQFTAGLVAQARVECRRYRWEAVRDQWIDIYHSLAPQNVAKEVGSE